MPVGLIIMTFFVLVNWLDRGDKLWVYVHSFRCCEDFSRSALSKASCQSSRNRCSCSCAFSAIYHLLNRWIVSAVFFSVLNPHCLCCTSVWDFRNPVVQDGTEYVVEFVKKRYWSIDLKFVCVSFLVYRYNSSSEFLFLCPQVFEFFSMCVMSSRSAVSNSLRSAVVISSESGALPVSEFLITWCTALIVNAPAPCASSKIYFVISFVQYLGPLVLLFLLCVYLLYPRLFLAKVFCDLLCSWQEFYMCAFTVFLVAGYGIAFQILLPYP